MTIQELLKYLEELVNEGYGDYVALNDGYLNEITKDNIQIDKKEKIIIL